MAVPEMRQHEETDVESSDADKIKPRPILRLGIFLVAHSPIFSVVFAAAGVFALLLLSVVAKNTYLSENALMPVVFVSGW